MSKMYRTNLGTVLTAVALAVCLAMGITVAVTAFILKGKTEMPEIEPVVSAGEKVDGEIDELLDDEFYDLSPEEKAEKTEAVMAALEEEGLVSEREYDEDMQLYYFTYQDGTWGTVDLKERSEETNGASEATFRPSAVLNRTDRLVYGESCDLVILNAFENSAFRRNFYEDKIQIWSDGDGLNVQYDTEVTVEDMRHLSGNDVVVFSMHGTLMRRNPALVLNEEASNQKDISYATELQSHSVAKICTEDGTYYTVLPAFFENTYGQNGLSGTFFFSESCEFFGDDEISSNVDGSFADALLSSDAGGVIGFHNSVMAVYSRDMMAFVVSDLHDGQSASEAYDAAVSKFGKDDGNGAYPVIRMEGDYTVEGAVPASTATPAPTAEPTYTAEPVAQDVYNGQIFKRPEYEGVCEFKVTNHGEDGYYIYLSYKGEPDTTTVYREHNGSNGGQGDDLSFYVAPLGEVEVLVPIGKYELYHCSGKTWYGTEYKFGQWTIYQTYDEPIDFYVDEEKICGKVLELQVIEGGNISAEPISAADFPD